MSGQKIKDIPQIQELLTQAQYFSRFEKLYPVLKPFLGLLGVDVASIEEALDDADIEELNRKAEELGSIPDRFNDLFADRGWIIYADMNLEEAKEAVEKAEAEGIEAGEEVLISHYDPETVEFNLRRMRAVDAFRPRMDLAEKALEDYREGRYHACVPVVLALMDGFVQEVYVEAYGHGRNWSSKEAQLEAWDSLAGHSKGLERLQELHLESRFKTRTEKIDVPYRNGIMHGVDLGYDNKAVAAKTWAALFALREWALKAERDELEAPDEEDQTVWEMIQETYGTIQRTEEIKQGIDEWQPREVVVGEDVPSSGEPEDYPEGSPERALVEFLTYWKKGNYGFMAQSLIKPKSGDCEEAGEIRREFEDWNLQSFQLKEIDDVGAARTDITVNVDLEALGRESGGEACVTLIRLDSEGDSAIRDRGKGTWTITNRIVLRTPD